MSFARLELEFQRIAAAMAGVMVYVGLRNAGWAYKSRPPRAGELFLREDPINDDQLGIQVSDGRLRKRAVWPVTLEEK